MPKRHNRTGRSKTEGQFVKLPYATIRHDAFRSLSGSAIKVFLELRSRYTVRGDGIANNNGELSLSLEEAARLLHLSKSTVHRAFKELENTGFIVKVKEGHWYGRKATQWRVTDCSYRRQPASRDWQKPKSEKQKSVPRWSMYNRDGTISVPKD